MNADEIRAAATERITQAFFEAEAADANAEGARYPDWKEAQSSGLTWRARHDAALAVAALGDLLPIGVEEERVQVFGIDGEIGVRVPMRQRFVCEWQEADKYGPKPPTGDPE